MKIAFLLLLGLGGFAIYELSKTAPASAATGAQSRVYFSPTTGAAQIMPGSGFGLASGISNTLSTLGQMFSNPVGDLPVSSPGGFNLDLSN